MRKERLVRAFGLSVLVLTFYFIVVGRNTCERQQQEEALIRSSLLRPTGNNVEFYQHTNTDDDNSEDEQMEQEIALIEQQEEQRSLYQCWMTAQTEATQEWILDQLVSNSRSEDDKHGSSRNSPDLSDDKAHHHHRDGTTLILLFPSSSFIDSDDRPRMDESLQEMWHDHLVPCAHFDLESPKHVAISSIDDQKAYFMDWICHSNLFMATNDHHDKRKKDPASSFDGIGDATATFTSPSLLTLMEFQPTVSSSSPPSMSRSSATSRLRVVNGGTATDATHNQGGDATPFAWTLHTHLANVAPETCRTYHNGINLS
eukprot:CAMPEP_0172462910 /NCGR_PEP_ID=MMETSP1065-20121228/45415_1 /TAXON_ID=265537 /ORGANISM="Amphiprora paludosa, Strain CCMP125" /LENGTH=314 /DNA_ID=CAMNT_0013218709 /DNA_START=59 /DNA_END=1003 /DNA_ORIENTATION=+